MFEFWVRVYVKTKKKSLWCAFITIISLYLIISLTIFIFGTQHASNLDTQDQIDQLIDISKFDTKIHQPSIKTYNLQINSNRVSKSESSSTKPEAISNLQISNVSNPRYDLFKDHNSVIHVVKYSNVDHNDAKDVSTSVVNTENKIIVKTMRHKYWYDDPYIECKNEYSHLLRMKQYNLDPKAKLLKVPKIYNEFDYNCDKNTFPNTLLISYIEGTRLDVDFDSVNDNKTNNHDDDYDYDDQYKGKKHLHGNDDNPTETLIADAKVKKKKPKEKELASAHYDTTFEEILSDINIFKHDIWDMTLNILHNELGTAHCDIYASNIIGKFNRYYYLIDFHHSFQFESKYHITNIDSNDVDDDSSMDVDFNFDFDFDFAMWNCNRGFTSLLAYFTSNYWIFYKKEQVEFCLMFIRKFSFNCIHKYKNRFSNLGKQNRADRRMKRTVCYYMIDVGDELTSIQESFFFQIENINVFLIPRLIWFYNTFININWIEEKYDKDFFKNKHLYQFVIDSLSYYVIYRIIVNMIWLVCFVFLAMVTYFVRKQHLQSMTLLSHGEYQSRGCYSSLVRSSQSGSTGLWIRISRFVTNMIHEYIILFLWTLFFSLTMLFYLFPN